jgi:hypothetical protein
MFHRLDQRTTGSLLILTGLPGAGKSHLAATARAAGRIWLLDTEGAAQTLRGKPDIHADLQVVQTLSLRQLLDAMRAITQQGKRGDTVILDSISKILQAMRAYTQQRAGGDTDRTSSLSYDEHASRNRNMQAISTGLTELKHAGFHVLIIGHLAKKYQTNGSALADVGLRVLADEAITYEADAVLLVERDRAKRTITPIMKPPRPAQLQLGQSYPATLATLYPALAVSEQSTVPHETRPVGTGPTTGATHASRAPKTPHEAERRFYARYGDDLGGATWSDVERFLGYESEQPRTVQDWIELASEIQSRSVSAPAA